ncbi:MAG: STAS domain-containing protein [Planctomycetota bacterium]|jgi:anti-anti-sigma factor
MSVAVVEASENLSHVAVSGRLTQLGVERLTAEFLTHTAKRGVDTIVDLSDVSFIASAGLGLLANCRKQLQRSGARMVLLNPQPQAAQAIKASRMDILFPLVHSVDQAKAALVAPTA